jgi:hypothetical protein
MTEHKDRRIWKIRTVKNYPEAHNHLLIGRVLQVTASYVRLECRTYHYGRSVNTPKDIRTGDKNIRIVPWNRIEIVNELLPSFNYNEAKLAGDEKANVVLTDGKAKCVIASSYDSRY